MILPPWMSDKETPRMPIYWLPLPRLQTETMATFWRKCLSTSYFSLNSPFNNIFRKRMTMNITSMPQNGSSTGNRDMLPWMIGFRFGGLMRHRSWKSQATCIGLWSWKRRTPRFTAAIKFSMAAPYEILFYLQKWIKSSSHHFGQQSPKPGPSRKITAKSLQWSFTH